jgi:hypothetical protein
MSGGFERRFGGIAAALVEASRSRPWLVVALCALLTAGSVYVAATILEIDTDSDRLLSPELRVGQTNRTLAEVFPDLQNNLVVMVEAGEPADARAAAEELAARLMEQPERYPGIFLPGDAPFYEDFGLYVNTLESFLPEDQAGRLAIFEQMRSDLESPVELSDDESGEGLDRQTAIEVTIEGYGVGISSLAQLLTIGIGLMVAANVIVLPAILTLVDS